MGAIISVKMTSRIPKILASATPVVAAITAKAAHDIEARAKQMAPVRTGFLRSSIQANKESATVWRVTVGADYGIYQEFGTRYMAAHPYLIPAAQQVAPAYFAALRAAVAGL